MYRTMPPKKTNSSIKKKTTSLTKKSKKVSSRRGISKKRKEPSKELISPIFFALQTNNALEHPVVSHAALSGHRARFEHSWIVVGCFSLLFASFLFLSSQIRAAETSGNGLNAAAVTATVLPNKYNTVQKNFFEKWYGTLDPITKLMLQSSAILMLLVVISLLLLHKKKSPTKLQPSSASLQSLTI